MKYSKFPRIYIKDELISNNTIEFEIENIHYIKKVLRLRNGDNLRLFNERDGEYMASIIAIDTRLLAQIKEKMQKNLLDPLVRTKNVVLLVSIIKSEKFELICDMATQLGVSSIVPIISSRVQKKDLNYERLGKIILESVRQCERIDIPQIEKVQYLHEINFSKYEGIYLANEHEDSNFKPTDSLLNKINIGVIIGPEGGFTEEEVEWLMSQDNVHSISLGPSVLRTETAAISMLAKILI